MKKTKKRKKRNPAEIMIVGFLAIILLGAILLKLPISTHNDVSVSFFSTLFTSVSAICVTGLSVVDTATTWSLFGRIVILCLIQIGGLGFMSVTTIFFFVMNTKIELSQRILIMQSLSLKDVKGVVQLIRHIFIGTLLFQAIGALLLWSRFYPQFGFWKGLGMGIFHSVSAFCNAGFDLMGNIDTFSSMTSYLGDIVIKLTLIFLVILGSLGFFVWEDIYRNRRFQKLHLHSKLVISTTAILLISGWIFFFFIEKSNLTTIGNLPFHQALITSLFQSAMPRSAGFSMVNQALLTKESLLFTMLLMFIGGSAGSTGGGIKNVTAAILFLSAIRSLRGRKTLSVFGRTIPDQQIVSAISILVLSLSVCFVGSLSISIIQPELPLLGIVFEVISAVATCGLSIGITPYLQPASMVILMLFMFFGRVGIMTIGMAAFLRRNKLEKTKYPDTWVMM
ncbi:MAG: Trk family potassium uptake protein [Candidatus Cloacimonetes bacterium]|nr:Trk family potassium uptake protein [Candidatus Cloacimonadota bacterium]